MAARARTQAGSDFRFWESPSLGLLWPGFDRRGCGIHGLPGSQIGPVEPYSPFEPRQFADRRHPEL